MIHITTLPPGEWEKYRLIRLEALQDSPQAFGTTLKEAQAEPESFWRERLEQAALGERVWLFFAQEGADIMGTIGAYTEEGEHNEHVANIVGFFVSPHARGKGVGEKLFSTILKTLQDVPRIVKIYLRVTTTQTPAIAIYEKYGFTKLALHKKVMCVNGTFVDEWEMEKFLQ